MGTWEAHELSYSAGWAYLFYPAVSVLGTYLSPSAALSGQSCMHANRFSYCTLEDPDMRRIKMASPDVLVGVCRCGIVWCQVMRFA